jgi:hypothetical protein
MTLEEIEARQDELNRVVDFMTEHGMHSSVLQYYHDRGAELDAMRPGDAS